MLLGSGIRNKNQENLENEVIVSYRPRVELNHTHNIPILLRRDVVVIYDSPPQRRHMRCACAQQESSNRLHPLCIARTWLMTVGFSPVINQVRATHNGRT